MAKAAHAAGKDVLWVTLDQAGTAASLAKHGALSEVVGEFYLRPFFRHKKVRDEEEEEEICNDLKD